jgi:NTE family protein
VAAVVFGPSRSAGPTALVLGAGGVLGAAWMTGALARLAERLPGPLSEVDLVVGTSAGSVLAAALRCGASFEEMTAWQRGQATGLLTESVALAAQDGPLPPLPRMRFGSVPLACAAVLTPHRVPPWVAASAWLPHGRGRHTALRSLITGLQQRAAWPGRATWISAVDYDTGQRVLFGRDGAPRASLTDAVVASCSIPGWYEPAVIGGRRYVDGGVRSMTSLDVLAATDIQDVYVLAPLASTQTDHPLQPHLRMERQIRQVLTHVVVRQARALAARGKRVTVLTPGPRDLAAMGINPMDPRRRQAVLELSFRTSAEALAGLDGAAPRAALSGGQCSSAASRVMSTPVSALLTGQPALASCATLANWASSRPSTSPRTVSLMPVSLNPPAGSGPSDTSACTSSACGVPPAWPISADSCIA